jgi:hypothetical protein
MNQHAAVGEQRHRAGSYVGNVLYSCPLGLRTGGTYCSQNDQGHSEHSQKLHGSPQLLLFLHCLKEGFDADRRHPELPQLYISTQQQLRNSTANRK